MTAPLNKHMHDVLRFVRNYTHGKNIFPEIFKIAFEKLDFFMNDTNDKRRPKWKYHSLRSWFGSYACLCIKSWLSWLFI